MKLRDKVESKSPHAAVVSRKIWLDGKHYNPADDSDTPIDTPEMIKHRAAEREQLLQVLRDRATDLP